MQITVFFQDLEWSLSILGHEVQQVHTGISKKLTVGALVLSTYLNLLQSKCVRESLT